MVKPLYLSPIVAYVKKPNVSGQKNPQNNNPQNHYQEEVKEAAA
jgi:hypothetical protein